MSERIDCANIDFFYGFLTDELYILLLDCHPFFFITFFSVHGDDLSCSW